MNRQILGLIALAFLFLPNGAAAQSQNDIYRDLLARYVSTGSNGITLVDYKKWKSSRADLARLDNYLQHLQGLKPSAMRRDHAFAFWVNLYNAATLKVILQNYPVASIRDIKSTGTGLFDFKAFIGPWRTQLVTVEGRKMSLDNIEHDTLRKQWSDPRVHYAVNCASLGCPNLKLSPWMADTLDADLNAAARDYVNHPRGMRIRSDGKLQVSSIYAWFQEDFGGSDPGVIRHLQQYAKPALRKKLKGIRAISSDQYSWTLNDSKNAGVRR